MISATRPIRLFRKPFALVTAATALLAAGISLASFLHDSETHAARAQYSGATYALQMALGNPSSADTRSRTYANYLKTLQNVGTSSSPSLLNEYDMSYSRYDAIPNWVSWHLSARDLGNVDRSDNYRADTTLPSGWYQVPGGTTFGTSGGVAYDRGHMCPSGDRTLTSDTNSATFVMTNFVPQTADNNEGPWEQMETYCRSLVSSSGDEEYIIDGNDGSLGKLSTNTNITIPAHLWKIVVIIRDDGAANDTDAGDVIDLNYITSQIRANPNTTNVRIIAVDMPNIAGIRSVNWGTYRTSVRNLEYYTGYNFLDALPQDVQDVLETRVDTVTIP